MIYILDEPTAGLHPKDTAGLLEILKRMRDLENTVLVIEHDTDIMAAADYIIDIGPGSGRHGGEIIASGRDPEAEIIRDRNLSFGPPSRETGLPECAGKDPDSERRKI